MAYISPLSVGFLLFDQCDLLDFSGPLEIFSNVYSPPLSFPDILPTSTPAPQPRFKTYVIAETPHIITSQHVVIRRDYDLWQLESCGIDLDILVVPGGLGTRKEMMNGRMLHYIRCFVSGHDDGKRKQCLGCSDKERWLLSVCTGSLILANAGVLDGCDAATHHSMKEKLEQLGKGRIKVKEGERVVWSKEEASGEGTGCHIVTAGGISSGLDAALVLVGRLFGEETAEKTARWAEYEPVINVGEVVKEQKKNRSMSFGMDMPDI